MNIQVTENSFGERFKTRKAEQPPDPADRTAAWIATQPYLVILRNCMDDTYDVLRSYGIPGLPLPFLEITPNRWFDQLSPVAPPVTPQALQQAGLLPSTHVETTRMAVIPRPESPPWRTPGKPEWQALHEQLLRPTLEKRLKHDGRPTPPFEP